MNRFLFFALLIFGSFAHAGDCSDINLSGTWVNEANGYFFRSPKTYRIKQSGCYLLVHDVRRNATWRVDLSGGTPIKAPPEIVALNLDGSGPIAENNIRNIEVKLTPQTVRTDYLSAKLDSLVQLDALPRFPFGIKAEFEADLRASIVSNCGGCSSETRDRIIVTIRKINVTDIHQGLTNVVDKPSFISGINTFLYMFLKGFGYRTDLLTLVRTSTP
jgi:hypothetical protein